MSNQIKIDVTSEGHAYMHSDGMQDYEEFDICCRGGLGMPIEDVTDELIYFAAMYMALWNANVTFSTLAEQAKQAYSSVDFWAEDEFLSQFAEYVPKYLRP